MAAWYAVQTKRYKEERVAQHYVRRGLTNFLPLIEVIRRYRGGRVRIIEPLFPGYLFLQMEPLYMNPAAWIVARWTPGVQRLVGTQEEPVPVPDGVIGTIQDRVRDLGFVRSEPMFRPGTQVRIQRGPFADLDAVFHRPLSREGRVQVLLDLLGQPRRVEVDLIDLERV